jgi:hypothetical protein
VTIWKQIIINVFTQLILLENAYYVSICINVGQNNTTRKYFNRSKNIVFKILRDWIKNCIKVDVVGLFVIEL